MCKQESITCVTRTNMQLIAASLAPQGPVVSTLNTVISESCLSNLTVLGVFAGIRPSCCPKSLQIFWSDFVEIEQNRTKTAEIEKIGKMGNPQILCKSFYKTAKSPCILTSLPFNLCLIPRPCTQIAFAAWLTMICAWVVYLFCHQWFHLSELS